MYVFNTSSNKSEILRHMQRMQSSLSRLNVPGCLSEVVQCRKFKCCKHVLSQPVLNSYSSTTNELTYNSIRLGNKVVLTSLVEAHAIGRAGQLLSNFVAVKTD